MRIIQRYHHKTKNQKTTMQQLKGRLALGALLLILMIGIPSAAFADRYQDQINALTNQNAETQGNITQLGIEAASLQDAISRLRAETANLQSQITANEAKRDETIAKIAEAEAKLAQQREFLKESLRAMYVDGDISSLEMLASSQDINDFVDQEQYQQSVQTQLQRTLDTVKQLKAQLDQDKITLERMIADLQAMRARVASQQAEQARLLSLNESQQAELDGQIKANNGQIVDLRRQQALENARLSGGATIISKGACGGGYPADALNSYDGHWGCNYSLDNTLDNWGMYNRECVSYTAYRVYASGRYMPAWGSLGRGNANQWDDNARSSGIPVDMNPQSGDVAISNSGTWGHAMYVEAVASDGSIYISDYNQQYDGNYREYWISAETVQAKGLVFIHF